MNIARLLNPLPRLRVVAPVAPLNESNLHIHTLDMSTFVAAPSPRSSTCSMSGFTVLSGSDIVEVGSAEDDEVGPDHLFILQPVYLLLTTQGPDMFYPLFTA